MAIRELNDPAGTPDAPLRFAPNIAPPRRQAMTRQQRIEERLQTVAKYRLEQGRAFLFRFQVQIPSPDQKGHMIGWPGELGHESLEAGTLEDARAFLRTWKRWIRVMGTVGPTVMNAALTQLETHYGVIADQGDEG